jgi:hypothetical protein
MSSLQSTFIKSEEMKLIKKWVKKGGSLFLIADHMPMAGAASELASVFGFGVAAMFTAQLAGPQSIKHCLDGIISS